MGIYKADGSRVTKSTFPATAVGDPSKVLTEDLYATRRFHEEFDGVPEGSIKTVFAKAGAVMKQSQIDALFPDATISTVTPATGGVAGGTVVTIKGTYLDGATSVTFGGTAGTALTVISPKEIRVTTPAKTAGAVTVAVVDDSGTQSKTNGFTYA